MFIPEEHIYIGLSEPLPLPLPLPVLAQTTENIDTKNAMNLRETELRLGLPGSDSPTRKPGFGLPLFGKDLKDDKNNGSSSKNIVSGAKRGFADSINYSGKWGLGINAGSEGNLVKTDASINDNETVKPLEETTKNQNSNNAPASKAQVVGWPPIRSFRKNTLAINLPKDNDAAARKSGPGCLYVKVSMDGAPYLRKIDLKTYTGYAELSSALEKMFSCFTIGQCGQGLAGQGNLTQSRLMDLLHGSEYVLTYEDKDGDWMLVGDVPWEMFMDSCKRLRIMKGSDAIGLAPRTMQKCQSQN